MHCSYYIHSFSLKPDKSSVVMGPPLSTSPIASTTLPTIASAALGNTTPIVVAVVVVLVAAIIAIFVVILTVAITKRKEGKEDKSSSNEESIRLNRINQPMDMYNPVYDSKCIIFDYNYLHVITLTHQLTQA